MSNPDDIAVWKGPSGEEKRKRVGDMTHSELKEWKTAYLAEEKRITTERNLSFRGKFLYHLDNCPWRLLLMEIRKMLVMLVIFTVIQAYNVIVQEQPNKAAFILAIISWVTMGVTIQTFRLVVFYNATVATVTAVQVAMSIVFLSSIACTIVGAVVAHEIQGGAFYVTNVIIYIVSNVLTIVGNFFGAMMFNRLRTRLISEAGMSRSYEIAPV